MDRADPGPDSIAPAQQRPDEPIYLTLGADLKLSLGDAPLPQGGLAAARYDAHPGQTGNDAGPVFKGIAAHKNAFIGAVGFLDNPRARDVDLARQISAAARELGVTADPGELPAG